MKSGNKNILLEAKEKIEALFRSALPPKIEVKEDSADIEKEFAATINQLIDFVSEISGFITPLSQGKLNTNIPQTKNFLASPFKELHSRLMHLTWQTQQVAKGDYSQRIDFMGDFSSAFNSMVVSLSKKDKEIQRKIAQLEHINKQMLYEIEERKQTEKALLSSESRLKEAERLANLGHWELNLVTDTLIWSDEIYHIFDINPNNFKATYKAFLDTVHPDDRGLVDKAYTDSIQKKSCYDIIHRLLLKNGTIKYVYEKCRTEYDESGNPIRSLGTVQDVTKTIIDEKKIQESEKKYRSMMDAMKNAAYICSPNFRIEYMNPAMIDMIGRDASGELCHKAIYDRDETCPWCIFNQVRQKEHVEYEVIDPRSNICYLTINSPISHIDGTISKLTIFHDISERKSQEIERERLINELKKTLSEVKTLRGFLPICVSCKKIRDDEGYWNQIEAYIRDHSEAEFSHGLCPDCARKMYPELHIPEDKS